KGTDQGDVAIEREIAHAAPQQIERRDSSARFARGEIDVQIIAELRADRAVHAALSEAKIRCPADSKRVADIAADDKAILLAELERMIEMNDDAPIAR